MISLSPDRSLRAGIDQSLGLKLLPIPALAEITGHLTVVAITPRRQPCSRSRAAHGARHQGLDWGPRGVAERDCWGKWAGQVLMEIRRQSENWLRAVGLNGVPGVGRIEGGRYLGLGLVQGPGQWC